MIVPIFSGLIRIDWMRGAYGESSDVRLRQGLHHLIQDEHAALVGLGKRLLQHLVGESLDLDVHLERGHAIRRAGDLEVHIAQVSSRPWMSVRIA